MAAAWGQSVKVYVDASTPVTRSCTCLHRHEWYNAEELQDVYVLPRQISRLLAQDENQIDIAISVLGRRGVFFCIWARRCEAWSAN